ncbi:MAG: Flp pilus assembly protein CpaB [Brevundimonas sp.]|uniref:Flp pilus assembly protein CpaB n=1 Tax=Brevundimonas sp. TaxID=1871086 RepID=UPI002734579D|nr:Flp pilus assembly protein CpaB [Brevundimonas sp.]MBX9616896.1 Flp pilus assembly protein CpaB [Caulobacteraceae bacterium]MDP3405152.1 Flp pilus assembly protein CpaB [Brevundimonas sp.]
MKPARIAVICIAAVSAVGLALVVRAMGSPSGQPTAVATAAAVPARPMAKVLVAARDLAPGQRLVDADLDWKDWPADEVNPAFITDGSVPLPQAAAAGETPDQPATGEGAVARVTRAATDLAGGGAKADYFGSVVREPILAGEPIVGRKIVRAGDSGYMAAYLEPGMRAMAIAVSTESAAGGFILPGDRVDVLVTIERDAGSADGSAGGQKFASRVVLQNVKVLAVDQSTRAADDQQAVVGATATLEIAPSDTETLALAKAAGSLSLVLRSYADTAGPSGRVGVARAPQGMTPAPAAVRVFRGGEPQVVSVP